MAQPATHQTAPDLDTARQQWNDAMAIDSTCGPLASLSFRGALVTIGPVLPRDTADLFLWLNDVEAANFDFAFRPTDWMTYLGWLTEFGKNPAQVLFAIRTLDQPAVIGFVALTKIHPVHRSAEIGVRIGSGANRGRGYGKDAIGLALQYCWDHLNLERVQLNVFANNLGAIGAYSAAGFLAEGLLRRAAFVKGGWIDCIIMGAIRPAMRATDAREESLQASV